MGDPKKARKKYEPPRQPWNKIRIEEEKQLLREYGLKNKQELLRMIAVYKNFSNQAKKFVGLQTPQSQKEEKQLMKKLQRLGILGADAELDQVLGLTVRDILERRLQTQVYKKGFARSVKQARQFITHQHVTIDGQKITAPGYLVSQKEEGVLNFSVSSSLNNVEHPERQIVSESKTKKEKSKTEKEASKEKTPTKQPAKQEKQKPEVKKEAPKETKETKQKPAAQAPAA